MVYKDFDGWFKANTKDLKKYADKDEDAYESLFWCEAELKQAHKLLNFYDDAIKEICSEEDVKKVNGLIQTYMTNDFLENTEFGKKMLEEGLAKRRGFKILLKRKKDGEED